VGNFVWPARLAVFYPYSLSRLPELAAESLVVLAGISILAFINLRKRPWLAVGWLWYLGTLVPVIGLVQVGAASHADRYTYLPAVGLSIMLAWGAAELAERWPRAKPAIAGLAAASCAACLCLAWFQVQYWENSITLFRHAIQVTSGNYVAYNNLGSALKSEGQIDEAIADFERAVEIRGRFTDALINLGDAYQAQGRFEEGARYSSAALSVNPASVEAHVNLGTALGALGRAGEAEAQFRQAVQLRADDPKAHNDLGLSLASQGKVSEALEEFTAAVRLDPGYATAQCAQGAIEKQRAVGSERDQLLGIHAHFDPAYGLGGKVLVEAPGVLGGASGERRRPNMGRRVRLSSKKEPRLPTFPARSASRPHVSTSTAIWLSRGER